MKDPFLNLLVARGALTVGQIQRALADDRCSLVVVARLSFLEKVRIRLRKIFTVIVRVLGGRVGRS